MTGVPHDPEDDWTRPMPRTPRGRAGDRPAPSDDDDTQVYDRGQDDRGYVVSRGRRSYDDWDYDEHDDDQDYDDERTAPVRPGGRPPGRPPGRRRPRYGLRRFLVVLLVLLLAYAGAMIWAINGVWASIDRVESTPTADGRPEGGAGTNFVLVGTDSREGLTRDERNDLVTGHAEGARADTIMLLHLPDSGQPTLLSIPRDSYVEIPGRGWNKINAAYSAGGPQLLVSTVEQSTGLRVDGYLEVGFGGFVEVVETVGGVEMCLDEPVQDDLTRLDLPAGCQELVGADALNYVRMRYSDPRGDLGRVERQREFLAALTAEMATPGTALVPWRLHDVGTSTGSALAIGEDTSMLDTGRMALAIRSISAGDGQSVTVPVADANYSTGVGSTVLWDEVGAAELFEALRTDAPLSIEP